MEISVLKKFCCIIQEVRSIKYHIMYKINQQYERPKIKKINVVFKREVSTNKKIIIPYIQFASPKSNDVFIVN